MNNIAGITVALNEAMTPEFKQYANQVIKNAKRLSEVLSNIYGFRIVSGGTDSHLMVIDLSSKNIDGKTAAMALEKAGIECSYSTIPYDPNPPMKPSGIRLGTVILTTIGMNEADMDIVAAYINNAIENYNDENILNDIKQNIKEWVSKYYDALK